MRWQCLMSNFLILTSLILLFNVKLVKWSKILKTLPQFLKSFPKLLDYVEFSTASACSN